MRDREQIEDMDLFVSLLTTRLAAPVMHARAAGDRLIDAIDRTCLPGHPQANFSTSVTYTMCMLASMRIAMHAVMHSEFLCIYEGI